MNGRRHPVTATLTVDEMRGSVRPKQTLIYLFFSCTEGAIPIFEDFRCFWMVDPLVFLWESKEGNETLNADRCETRMTIARFCMGA